MAEIKNTFLKSKMNKDLDERLLPNGEYRDAQNIAISKSEDSNVGAAENVQGTELVLNGNIGKIIGDVLGTVDPLVIIGQYADEINSRIYLFLTDNFVEKLTYIKTSQNAIVRYDIDNGNIYIYSAGTFLNFSTGYQIRNINIVEDLMFWTDNRNQPRVININNPDATLVANFTSIADLPYTTEDQITVCKYNPYKPIEVWKDNGGVIETTMVDAVSSASPMIAQVQMADNIGSPAAPQEINIDTATYTPGMSDALAVSEGFQIWTSDGQITPEDNVYIVSSPGPGTFVIAQRDGTNFQARFEAFGSKPVMLYFGYENPNWENTAGAPSYPGNQDFLTDKFVRFSYRFKFTDGEFSLMAPFTQVCFIPKQYGYFLEGIVTPTGDEVSDETRTYESTVVSFMENLVNRIFLQIPMPDGIDGSQLDANELLSVLNIEEIELLYKESDSLAVQVVDRITTEQLNTAGAVTTYEYDYLATEPFKTLPENQTTRVYDKVPVKALGQEVISNRIVYSNFQNKHTPPVSLDYNVGVSSKIPYDEANSNYSYSAYPNHTVKQNRYYQVGIVLSDRYGRTSTVLLSNNQSFVAAAAPNPQFGADTIYVPYQDEYDTQNFNNIVDWPGNSLKIYFNNIIDSAFNPELGTPGLYNGDPTSSDYNPLGWYTYKVVVKQKQQDYYNVYLPGILTGLPEEAPNYPDGEIYTSTITLFNDNINKVPRDLKEVGPDQVQFRSSVELFGRVSPELPIKPAVAPIPLPLYNTQYLPELVPDITTQIARQSDLFQSEYWQDSTVQFLLLQDVYDTASNPYLARVSTQKLIGSRGNQIPPPPADSTYPFFLSVYETKPVESKLELFWETSTTGKILDLNNAINTTIPSIPAGIEDYAFDFVEDRNYTNPVQVYTTGQGPIITNDFYVEDALGSAINNTSMTMTIVDGNGTDVTATVGITLVETAAGVLTPNGNTHLYDSYTLQISEYFVFLSNSQIRTWELYFVATNDATGDIGPSINLQLALDNAAPQFDPYTDYRQFPYNSFGILPPPASNPVYGGVNGTADPTPAINEDELIFSIIEQSQYGVENNPPIFSINPDTGELSQNPQTIMTGPYFIKLAVTDALGATGALTTIIELNFDFGEPSVTCTFIDSGEAINLLEGSDAGLVIWSNKSTGLTVTDYNTQRPGSAGNPSTPPYAPGEWSKILDPQNPANVNTITYGTPGAGFTYDVKSLDLSDGPNWCTLSGADRGLLKGVAYITVSLVQTIDPGIYPELPGVLDLNANVWIQRRTGGALPAPWTNAIDIEGQVVGDNSTGLPIGGEWLVNYPINQATGEYSLNLGSLIATNGETGGYPQPYEDHYLNGRMAKPQSSVNQQLFVQATRTFAFSGDDPLTRGDYRVMITNLNGTQTEWPSPTTTVGNTGVYRNENCTLSITYGDFYYPFGITNPSWRYSVATVAEPDSVAASNYGGVEWTEVFAREPFFRYVTQFYTDSTLTTPWNPTQVGTNSWHAYKARPSAGTSGPGNPNGNDGAAVTLNNFNNSNSNPQADRIWIAQFNSTGLKTGLSYPKSI